MPAKKPLRPKWDANAYYTKQAKHIVLPNMDKTRNAAVFGDNISIHVRVVTMEVGINIRPAVLSDARAIAEVHVKTWQAAYRDIIPDEYLKTLSVDGREAVWRSSIARGTPELWVADSQSLVIGWVAFGTSRDADAAPDTGELEAIYVLPDHWSTGAGRALWQTAGVRLGQRGFSRVTLWALEDNKRAASFYRAAGFAPDLSSRKELERGSKRLWEIRYTRRIK